MEGLGFGIQGFGLRIFSADVTIVVVRVTTIGYCGCCFRGIPYSNFILRPSGPLQHGLAGLVSFKLRTLELV